MIAYCGLDCSLCPIFIATKEEDLEKRKELALKYSSDKNQFSIDDIYCLGCFDECTKNSKMCGNCEIRICATNEDVKTCGSCKSYPCESINKYIKKDSEERKRLDDINSSH